LTRTDPTAQHLPAFYTPNPIGTGRWGGKDTRQWIQRQADALHNGTVAPCLPQDALTHNFDAQARYRGPQIEAFERPFDGSERDYPTVGYGPIARWWQPRQRLAGTHDEKWKASQWPKSPKDHDYRYWNFAPEDQQITYPQGGEEIVLANLTPPVPSKNGPAGAGQTVRFVLPEQPLKALVRTHAGLLLLMPMHIDTVIIDLAQARLSIVRRALVPGDLQVRKLELGTWTDDSAALSIDSTAPNAA
jgi:hypothetical protein